MSSRAATSSASGPSSIVRHLEHPVDLGVVGQLAADALADRRRRGLADEHLLGVPAEQVGHHGQQHADRDRGPGVPERLPGQLVQPEPERGQHEADQRGGVLGEHRLHGRVGGQPDVLDQAPAGSPASARSCRTALSQDVPSATNETSSTAYESR